jgi:hypothetical protein
MYIGHYAAAGAILALVPGTPVFPIAVAVAYPDLLWPLLVYLGKEKVKVSRMNPLQKAIKFTSYPHSHSLVRSAFLDLIPSIIFGMLYQSVWVAFLFWLGALSHWLLDAVVHIRDLPVLGSKNNDKYVGLGLWATPKIAFVFEYVFFAIVIILTAPPSARVGLLIGGFVLHALNGNSFFAFTKKNITNTPNKYATLALVGFIAAITWFTLSW